MSSVILSESKSVLAKLLAGENINVVHKRISTAMIDLKTRTLYCPIWEDMNGELYDLLMGHEVSHALHTPSEGWHSAITIPGTDKIDKAFKSVLNIVEDARIEKLIKRKYPGIAKSFVEGYKILFERDFFGIKKLKDYSKLNLADRINLYAKCGAFLIVPFNDEERELMNAVAGTETWEQVMEVAARLHEKMKEEQDSQMNSLDDLTEELMRQFEEGMEDLDLSEDDGEESGESQQLDMDDMAADGGEEEEPEEGEAADGDKPSNEEGDEEGEEEGAGGGDEESEDDPEEGIEKGGGEGDGEESDEEDGDEEGDESGDGAGEGGETDDGSPRSITDQKFREREHELVTDAVEVFTYNLPIPVLDRIIVPNKVFVDNFYDQVAGAKSVYALRDKSPNPITETCGKRFSQNNNRYINLLVKEFEMRKNASQYARTMTARTGELDMSKLHKYKYSNDLFKKISVVEKGKSHGMIMYVDMSASMSGIFGATMEQTLILVAFCRKVGIPFDVYGFADTSSFIHKMIREKKLPGKFVGRKFDRTNDDNYGISEDNFHLIHFIGSNLAGSQYHRAFDLMATVALNWGNKMYPKIPLKWDNMGLSLGGTPFTQTVMASRPMIEQFKADRKVDITNVIYLTDGDGTGCFTFPEIKPGAVDPVTRKPKIEQHIFLIDRKTKRRVEFSSGGMYDYANNHQVKMTQFVRSVTGCKHIGFYVGDSHSLKRSIYRALGQADEKRIEAFEKFWKANGHYSLPSIGYDMYYYVRQTGDNLDDNDYTLTEDMSSKKIAKVFSNAQGDKRKHRALVSKFAQDIAA